MNSKFIKSRIDLMMPEDSETCLELIEHIRRCAGQVDREIALHAVHLIAFEILENENKESTNPISKQ